MPMWCPGKHSRSRRGVTLVEMMVVVAVIGLLAGLSYPAMMTGIEAFRINGAADEVASFLNAALTAAERRQQAVEVIVSPVERALIAATADPRPPRRLDLAQGVVIEAVLPALPANTDPVRRFLVFPGGAVPRVAVVLGNSRGDRRIVSVDPITGAPQIRRLGPGDPLPL